MPRLINYTDLSVDSLIDILKNQYIVVYEDIQGSTIYVQSDGKNIRIKPRNIQNDDLNTIDLAIQKYYGPVFDYFNNLDPRIKSLMPDSWWFEFEYFFDNTPAHITYDQKPKNGLVLTGIVKGKKRKFNLQELKEYSSLIGVDELPVIFAGKLTNDQTLSLQAFMETSENDLEYIFSEKNFSNFFYQILNPSLNSSAFMNSGNFQNNLEKLIIKVPKQNKEISFTILNPLYKKKQENENKTDFIETYSIILLSFLEYSQLIDVKNIKIKGESYADLYMDLICKLFNNWMKWSEDSFKNFEFVVPTFFHEEKFKVNIVLIKNPITKSYVQKNEKIEYAFRCVLGSFQNLRKKPIGILNETSLVLMNKLTQEIQNKIDSELNLVRTSMLKNKDLMNFDQFDQVKSNFDSNKESYPDVYQEVEKEHGKKKMTMSKKIAKKQ